MSALTPRFTITNTITAGLTAIERARGFLEAATLSDDWLRRMSQRALLLEAHHTTHIEGTQLTIEVRIWRRRSGCRARNAKLEMPALAVVCILVYTSAGFGRTLHEVLMRTRLFKSGNSLAVRIPKELHFDAPATEVEIERVGTTLVVRQVGPPLTNVLKKFAAFSPGFMRASRGKNAERNRQGW